MTSSRYFSCFRPCGLLLFTTISFALVAPASFAAQGAKHNTPSEALFLAQIVILVIVGRLLGELMVRIGQPSIMGQIIGGILLGPTVFGSLWPDLQLQLFPSSESQKSMADAVAQLGILFLLLLAGMETDLGLAIRLRKAALGVSLTGICWFPRRTEPVRRIISIEN